MIADRLPFPASTLKSWVRKGPFAACFMRAQNRSTGAPLRTLVDLDLFAARFEDLAQQTTEEDQRHHVRLAGLNERERFHRLIVRPEASGEKGHRARGLEKHQLARKEEPAVYKARVFADEHIGRLFERKLDVDAEDAEIRRAEIISNPKRRRINGRYV